MSSVPHQCNGRGRFRVASAVIVTNISSSSSTKNALVQLEPARRVRSRVQIAAGRGDVGVAECRLDLGEGGSAVEGVAAMGVSEPMRGNGLGYPSSLCCALQHVPDSALGQPPTALMRGKDWIVRPGVAAEVEQRGADEISLVARLMPNDHVPESLRYSVCNLSLRSGLQAQSVSIVMQLCAGSAPAQLRVSLSIG